MTTMVVGCAIVAERLVHETRVPGYLARDCCPECHEDAERYDHPLFDVEVGGRELLVCCHWYNALDEAAV